MTVTELRARMPYGELLAWQQYTAEMGPLNPILRIDAAVARAVAPFVKGDVSKLMPYPKEPEKQASLDDFMEILKSAKKVKKAGKRKAKKVGKQ